MLTPAAFTLSPQRSAFPAARTGATRPAPVRDPQSAGVPAYWVRLALPLPWRPCSVLRSSWATRRVSRSSRLCCSLRWRASRPTTRPPPAARPFADPVAIINSFNGAGYAGLSPTLQPVALSGR